MIKRFTALFAILFGLFVMGTSSAFAAPDNAVNNPQVFGPYTGVFGIIGESEPHTGTDTILRAGQGGVVQQWFFGTTPENGGVTEGDHSVWQPVGVNGCAPGWYLVEDPYPEFGTWFLPNTDYCVHTNDYNEHAN